ncbi:hypothetical protein MPD5_0309 [Melissococcus plutonius DAT561]|nr:hypothetical protein MPD5_0309 [Melissococcus plutonius DAT561]
MFLNKLVNELILEMNMAKLNCQLLNNILKYKKCYFKDRIVLLFLIIIIANKK